MFKLVSRKKLDIALSNNKILNKQRLELAEENKKLQRQILIYKRSLNQNDEVARKCKKCNKLFIPQRKNQTYCQHCINKRSKINNKEKKDGRKQ